jgi:hypothetical protein
MEKTDILLKTAFGFRTTVFVSPAAEKVRIMVLTPLAQQRQNSQKFIVNKTRHSVFIKPTKYSGKCGKRMNVTGVLAAELTFLRARQMFIEIKKLILV